MCTMNTNCEAHYLEASQCFEANASSLIGSTPDDSTSRTVSISSTVYEDHRGIWMFYCARAYDFTQE